MQVSHLIATLAIFLLSFSLSAQDFPKPVNGLIAKPAIETREPLPYPPLREADIMWQKTVWRVIDVREKMNHPFTNPERPFFTILTEAADQQQIQLYADDDFREVLSDERRQTLKGTSDTVMVYDIDTGIESPRVIINDFDVRDVKRYRIKEVWYVDKNTATLRTRILGISPLKEVYDENGNFRYELPLFWVYYPGSRKVLARENAPTMANVEAGRTWENLLESRYFSSSIIKEDNVYDRKLDSYLVGRDAVLAGEKIDHTIFNFEQDLWAN